MAGKKEGAYGVVIVTHNSAGYIDQAVEAIENQSVKAEQIVIVDSGSTEANYLAPFRKNPRIFVHSEKEDIGICRAYNLGEQKLASRYPFVLFMNHDLFPFPDAAEQALRFFSEPGRENSALLMGILLGYDFKKQRPTGLYDSTGIVRTRGRWLDRDQGRPIGEVPYVQPEEIPGASGAMLFCRRSALDRVRLRGREVFDETLIHQKDDVEFSCRLRRQGYQIFLDPRVRAYHCRGWGRLRQRLSVPRWERLLSARNELLIDWRYPSPYLPRSLLKYLTVKLLDW